MLLLPLPIGYITPVSHTFPTSLRALINNLINAMHTKLNNWAREGALFVFTFGPLTHPLSLPSFPSSPCFFDPSYFPQNTIVQYILSYHFRSYRTLPSYYPFLGLLILTRVLSLFTPHYATSPIYNSSNHDFLLLLEFLRLCLFRVCVCVCYQLTFLFERSPLHPALPSLRPIFAY